MNDYTINYTSNEYRYYYDLRHNNYLSFKEDRLNEGLELKRLCDILDVNNVKYWLDWGSILGAYRNGKVISQDNDIDLSVLLNEKTTSKFLIDILKEKYCIMEHNDGKYVCVYPRNNNFSLLHIDLYLYFENSKTKMIETKIWDNSKFRSYHLDELEYITFENQQIKCPRHLPEYLSIKYGDDFMIEKKTNHNVVYEHPSPKTFYTAYTYGVYDMFHIGHLNLFKRIKKHFDKLIVGVHNDRDVSEYKDPPLIPYEQRLAIVESNKYVDEVIENVPLHIDDEFLNKLSADYFVYGREDKPHVKKYYNVSENKLHVISRTENVSTTLLKTKLKNNEC